MMSKQSFRSSYWDNIKGFLIFLVVFAHCLYDFQDDALIGAIVKSIYLFHMPAFIFVSGFFGKSERSRSSKSILTLLFAYFIFDSITGIIMGWSDLLIPVCSYWYIIALVLWRIGAKYVPKNAVSLIVALIVSICVGFASVITNNLALSRVIAFFPFYLAGLMLPKEHFSTKPKLPVPGLIAFAAAIGIGYFAIHTLDIQCGSLLMGSYSTASKALDRICFLIVATAAIISVLAFAPQQRLPLLTAFGRNSLPIFLLHRLITLAFSANIAGQSSIVILFASFLLSFVICLVFGNDLVGRFISRYLEDGAELVLRQKDSCKPGSEYAAVALSAVATAAAIVISCAFNI